MSLHSLFTTDSENISTENHFLIDEKILKSISFLTTPNTSLAVFEIPLPAAIKDEGLIVALDAVRDPGNLGAIIRLCDWFGVERLLCTEDSVDCYNPKVVQATMGSLARVNIHYLSLEDYLEKTSLPVYGGFMDGVEVGKVVLPEEAILIFGNEANGISETISEKINNRISIPRYGKSQKTERLNVATAAAIFLNEFRRITER